MGSRWRLQAATSVGGWNGAVGPSATNSAGIWAVGVDRDDEDALSRLWDEQRSVDHQRAEAVAGVGQRGADRVEVLAAM